MFFWTMSCFRFVLCSSFGFAEFTGVLFDLTECWVTYIGLLFGV